MLIELKDGDTIIIYGNMDFLTSDYYDNLTNAMTRGLKDVKTFMAPSAQDSIVVYRASPSVKNAAPAEEHDGWFPMHTAPRDGQLLDVWVVDSPLGDRLIRSVYFADGVFRVGGNQPVGDYGTPTHWRYPVKGPKA